MKNLLKSWTTKTLTEAKKEYTSRMKDYNKSEKKSWTFKNLKQQTELITAELKTR
tara:strand:- start:929 stop:1093 length:165 start_codon:yes stop_codon:yes gene_type:complete